MRNLWWLRETPVRYLSILEICCGKMSLTIEITPDPKLGGFTARLPDISAYGERDTETEAIDDLKEAIPGYIETFGLADAVSRLA